MFTLKEYEILKNNAFSFKLSKDKRFVKLYKNNEYSTTIFNSPNTLYFFCPGEFVKTTGEEILTFFQAVDQLK